MQTAESMADGGELEPEVQLVMRHANSNQRHVERLRQARDLQAQKEAKLRVSKKGRRGLCRRRRKPSWGELRGR